MTMPATLGTACSIVNAGANHAKVIAALHASCFAEGWDERAVGEILAMPGAAGGLALDGPPEGGEPVGFVLLRTAADEAEILSIGVVPSARRLGVAARLVEAAQRLAAAAGATALFLEVEEHNEAALALYQRTGFTRIGMRPSYYSRSDGPAAAALTLRCALVPRPDGDGFPAPNFVKCDR